MKYERLTTRNNLLGIVINKKVITLQGLLDSLAELEDKIERGELIPAAEYESARHRAEVVERAFDNTIKVFHEMLSAIFPSIKIDLDEWKKDNLAIAEKELAEGKKE